MLLATSPDWPEMWPMPPMISQTPPKARKLSEPDGFPALATTDPIANILDPPRCAAGRSTCRYRPFRVYHAARQRRHKVPFADAGDKPRPRPPRHESQIDSPGRRPP